MKKFYSPPPKLIKVCAWCPKASYPALSPQEEYTHGMCLKHYKQLSLHKQVPIELYISSFVENTFTKFSLEKYSKKLRKLLKSQKHKRGTISHSIL